MARKSNAPANTPQSHIKSRATPLSSARKRKFTDDGETLDWDSFKGFSIKPSKRLEQDVAPSSATPKFEGTDLVDRAFELSASCKKYWNSMNKFRKFTIVDQKFETGDFVYVKPAAQQNKGKEKAPVEAWVAKVLEVRAWDANHVFLRVFWFFRPEDLPNSRRPYHGCNELVASNAMDIIDANTVDGPADVMHWEEDTSHSETLDPYQLFWRQTFDVTKPKATQLSELPLHCIDNQPTNPDDVLIQCESCKKWLHGRCLEEAALEKVYAENNMAKPQKGRSKKRTKAFEAKISVVATAKPCVTITDKRPRAKAKAKDPHTWTIPIHCLFCEAVIEDKDETTDDGDAAASSDVGEAIEVEAQTPSTPSHTDDVDEEESVLDDGMSSPVKVVSKAVGNPLASTVPAATTARKRKGPQNTSSQKRQKTAHAAADTLTTTHEKLESEPGKETHRKSASQVTPPPSETPEPGILQSGLRRLKQTFIKSF